MAFKGRRLHGSKSMSFLPSADGKSKKTFQISPVLNAFGSAQPPPLSLQLDAEDYHNGRSCACLSFASAINVLLVCCSENNVCFCMIAAGIKHGYAGLFQLLYFIYVKLLQMCCRLWLVLSYHNQIWPIEQTLQFLPVLICARECASWMNAEHSSMRSTSNLPKYPQCPRKPTYLQRRYYLQSQSPQSPCYWENGGK